jgi:hypothetical protein
MLHVGIFGLIELSSNVEAIKMTFKDEAEQLLRDPLLPLSTLAAKWGVTAKFLRLESKRNRLKILRLSPRVCRVRASEALRYERACA